MTTLRLLLNMVLIAIVTVALHFVFPQVDLLVLWVLSTLGLAALSLIWRK